MSIVSVRNVKKSYKKKVALNIDRLDIEPGELVGIVGNNGAGKTTLFRSILDLIKPDSGVVFIGEDVVANSNHWKTLLHAFLDESFLIEFLKPQEYFEFIGKTLGLTRSETKAQIGQYQELHNDDITTSTKLIRELSTGSKVRVGLLATLLGDPKIILLDEPYAHLDPSSQAKLSKLIKQLNEKGVTVILSSHNLHNMAQICTRIILIESGEVIKDEQTSDEVVQEINAYFEGA